VWMRKPEAKRKVWRKQESEVATERLVFDALQTLITKGTPGDSFLIVSSGDSFVQFLFDHEKRSLHCEAAGDDHLSERALSELRDFGFEKPNKDSGGNYPQTILVQDDVVAVTQAAELAVQVLSKVYQVSLKARLDLQLHLG